MRKWKIAIKTLVSGFSSGASFCYPARKKSVILGLQSNTVSYIRVEMCRHFYTELTAGVKRIYTQTLATAVIVCRRDMYPQGVALCEFFVPHHLIRNLMWYVATMNVAKRTILIV